MIYWQKLNILPINGFVCYHKKYFGFSTVRIDPLSIQNAISGLIVVKYQGTRGKGLRYAFLWQTTVNKEDIQIKGCYCRQTHKRRLISQ